MQTLSRVLVALAMLVPLMAAAQSVAPSTGIPRDVAVLRHTYCAALGGDDISDAGAFSSSGDGGVAVACRLPSPASGASAKVDPAISLPPFTYAGAALYPPSGAVTVAASNPFFNTSCAADIYVKPIPGLPTVSHGTSTVSCTGYNSARGVSNNCSVSWAGPTDVTVGAEPYGGHVVVAFSCQVIKPGSIGTSMSLRYADPTFTQWTTSQNDVAGAIGITVQ